MSIIQTVLNNKVKTLKILLVISVVAGGVVFTKIRYKPLDSSAKPDVLGNEVAVKATPTPSQVNDFLKQAEKNVTTLINNPVSVAKNTAKDVLGSTTQVLQNAASQSAQTVSNAVAKTVIQTAAESIIKQIDKLPAKDKEEIKKDICK